MLKRSRELLVEVFGDIEVHIEGAAEKDGQEGELMVTFS